MPLNIRAAFYTKVYVDDGSIGGSEGTIGTRAIAIALVAVSKSLASINPDYRMHLTQALRSAEDAGLESKDLEVLKLLIKSAAASAAKGGPNDRPS